MAWVLLFETEYDYVAQARLDLVASLCRSLLSAGIPPLLVVLSLKNLELSNEPSSGRDRQSSWENRKIKMVKTYNPNM